MLVATCLLAEDWPEWRGKGRTGVWTETGIIDKFPAEGLKAAWRTPVRAGFAGPAVANGRVFVTDYENGTERALALDEKTGKILWTREWPAKYQGISYATGPRATPTVDGDRVYVAGRRRAALPQRANGSVIWQKDYVKDYGTEMPRLGHDQRAAGRRQPPDRHRRRRAGRKGDGVRQADRQGNLASAVLRLRAGLLSANPGRPAAHHLASDGGDFARPGDRQGQLAAAVPGPDGDDPGDAGPERLAPAGFILLQRLDDGRPGRRIVSGKGKSDSEINTDGLHAVVNTPVIDGDYIYGICSYGQFRCLNLKTGERVWETMDVTKEKARWASGFIVRHGDRYFINNDRGELIIAKLLRPATRRSAGPN